MSAPEFERQTMTVAEVDALTGDDMAYWLGNPFMTPDLLAEKVCWWVTTALAALAPADTTDTTADEKGAGR